MKRVLIVLLAGYLVTILCACSIEPIEFNKSNDYDTSTSDDCYQFVEIDSIEDASPDIENLEVLACDDPFCFCSEEELCNTVTSKECTEESLISLTKYFRPKTLASDLVLTAITVKSSYVALRYDFNTDMEVEEYQNGYYLFEWYRDMETKNLQDEVSRVSLPGAVKQIAEYYIVCSGELQDVFWEEEGNVFHAVTPASLSMNQLRAFCGTEMVQIQQ